MQSGGAVFGVPAFAWTSRAARLGLVGSSDGSDPALHAGTLRFGGPASFFVDPEQTCRVFIAGDRVSFERAPSDCGQRGDIRDLKLRVRRFGVPVHALLGNQEAYLILRQLAELAEGWNWWAPTVQMSVADLQAALDDLEAVISKDGELTNGEDVLVPGQMYKLQISEDCSLNVLGIVVPNASVTIGSGYNWFGCTVETDIDDLNITPAEGDKIISQDQGFAIFNGTSWEGTLTTLESGKGYVYIRMVSGN